MGVVAETAEHGSPELYVDGDTPCCVSFGLGVVTAGALTDGVGLVDVVADVDVDGVAENDAEGPI